MKIKYAAISRIMSRKYIGYAGQIAIVLVSLYLLYIVGMEIYLYNVVFSDGSPEERWDRENTVGLFWWGFYLLVTGTHLFLYFKRLSSMKKFNVWALPTFNIEGMKILSGVLSAFFLLFVFFFHTTMPEVYTPSVSYIEYKEMPYYNGIDSFWAMVFLGAWEKFTFWTTVHLLFILSLSVREESEHSIKS